MHTVVVSHSHPDHYGAAQRIRAVSGAELVTHENFKTYWDPHEEDDFIKEVAPPGGYDYQAGVIEGALLKMTNRERHSPWDRPLPWGWPAPRQRVAGADPLADHAAALQQGVAAAATVEAGDRRPEDDDR